MTAINRTDELLLVGDRYLLAAGRGVTLGIRGGSRPAWRRPCRGRAAPEPVNLEEEEPEEVFARRAGRRRRTPADLELMTRAELVETARLRRMVPAG